jgi:hypothetical protein
MRSQKFHLLTLGLFFSIVNLFAQKSVTYISTPIYLNSVDTTTATNQNFIVKDVHHPFMISTVQHQGSKASVIAFVDYDDNSKLLKDTAFEYFIDVKVNWYGSSMSSQTEFRTLHIHHTTFGNSLDRFELRKNNAYRVDVTILRVKDQNQQIVPFSTLPGRLKIMARIESIEKNLCLATSPINYNLTVTKNTTKKIIDITWSPFPCADFYELEWVYVDDYNSAVSYSPAVSPSQLSFTFYQEAMRVRVKDTKYQLPMVFDRGYVLFRVRAVEKRTETAQYDSAGYYAADGYRYYPWSASDFWDPITRKPIGNVATFSAKVYISDGERWERGKNWFYEFVSDEEGQAHHIISYYDGLFLKKQEVSVVKDDSVAVVKEWFYDVWGRESVSTLPSVEQDTVLLKYYSNLNKNLSGQKFHYQNFMLDSTQVAGCGGSLLLPNKMDMNSGSSKYYSANNLWKNVEMHKAVPDANGYPYVLQRFTNEPQGRVRETGLAGDTLMTGGRRSTLYYYGTPLQEELDRLLGNNAGYASYYTKTLIRDPNGGWMSEIKDLTGKVVISSMERRGSHLLPLQDTLVYLKSYLIQRDSGGWHDGLAMDSLGDTYQKTLVLPGGDVDWGYYLQVPTYQDTCLPNICMDCAFDWKLKIQSSCGTDYVAGHSAASKKMGYPAGVDTVDVVCDSTTRIIAIDSVRQNWDGGEVHITRELSLNTQALQQYFQEYLKNNKCIKSYEDFLAEEMSKIDSSLCHLGMCRLCRFYDGSSSACEWGRVCGGL